MQQLTLFNEARLPRRPYSSRGLDIEGLRIRRLSYALRHPYMQINPPRLRVWMIHDIDRPGAALAWENTVAPPAWAAINRVNAHAHLAWALDAPVLTGEGARSKPLRYLTAVERAYREALGADHGFSGLITKNPVHPQWQVLIGPQRTYDLAELAEWIPDLAKHVPKRGNIEAIGLGRNCLVFDMLRLWAYRAVREYRTRRDEFFTWRQHCYTQALCFNHDACRTPLMPAECYHIARSVSKWVWRRDQEAAEAFRLRQAAKGRASGAARRLGSLTEAQPWVAEGVSRATWYRRLRP